MFKPAIIIGLGGTGVMTLRHLKARPLASNERSLPLHVKLIALDTVKGGGQSAHVGGETQIAAQRTELEPGEYVWLGGDFYDLVRRVDRGEHPHIGSWFQAHTYLERLPRVSFSLERGAGQLRQFGRLAVFHDVGAPALSVIYNRFTVAIRDIITLGHREPLDVFVVSSAAGGTGAGVFVDIAYLVQQIAREEFHHFVRLRGFLVLPEVFSLIPGAVKPVLCARAYACMREIKRVMMASQYENGYPMHYHASGSGGIWRNAVRNKLFDTLYYVDGRNHSYPLSNSLPEYGVTAAIGDTIAAMLDRTRESEEDAYDMRYRNIHYMGLYTGDEGRASFTSAMGSFSIVLPMHHMIEWLAHRLTLEALDTLLEPRRKDKDGYPTALADDANAESPGVRGRDMAARFGRAAETVSFRTDEQVTAPSLFLDVAKVADELRTQDTGVVKKLSSREARIWEMHLEPYGTADEIIAVRQRVGEVLTSRLEDEVPASLRGEGARDALHSILDGVQIHKDNLLGREDVRSGKRVGGQYQMSLEEYTKIQLARYRLLLRTECENILNGGLFPHEPASIQRGGKLGFLLDLLTSLEDTLGLFLEAMNKVKEIRRQRGEKQAAISSVEASRREMEQRSGGLLGGRRRKQYLDAEQELIGIEKTLIIEDIVCELVDAALGHVRQLRESAQSWASILGIGYDSLYARLLKSERQIRHAIEAEQQVPVREFVWDRDYLDHLYDEYARKLRSGVDDYLPQLAWHYEQQRTGVRESCGVYPFIRIGEDETPIRLGLENRDSNLELILTPARQVFVDVQQQESILKYLMTWRFPDPKALASHLASKAGVQLRVTGTSGVPSSFFHVAYDDGGSDQRYVDSASRYLTDLPKGGPNRIVNSSDQFRCCLVTTLDLVPLEELDSYRASGQDYWEISDRRTLHVFPAEVKSASYECRLSDELGLGPFELQPEVVTLLEYPELVALFARAHAYDLIREGSSTEGENYLHLCLADEGDGTGVPGVGSAQQILLTRPRQQEPDLIEALFTFVYGGRDVRPDVYLAIDYPRVEKACSLASQAVGGARDNISVLETFVRDRIVPLERDASEKAHRALAAVMHVMVLDEIKQLTELGQLGLEFFSMLWSDIETPDYQDRIQSFSQRLARECAIELTSLEVNQGPLHLVMYKVGSLFEDFPSLPKMLPVLFFRGTALSQTDVERIRQLLEETVGSSPQIAILIVFSDDRELPDIRDNLYETMHRVYAYDIIVPSREELRQIIVSNHARQAFRKLVLSQVALITVSPFIISGSTSDAMFFGREKELRELAEHTANTSYALIGGRRIGKTSILSRLHRVRLPDKGFRTIYQDCSIIPTYEAFLATPIRDWRPELPSDSPATFGELLQSPPDDKPLVLLLDEADKLIPTDRDSNWRLFNILRSLINSGRAQVILAGERTLQDALRDPTSPLFNFADEILLGPLDHRSVEELVTRPMKQLEIELLGEKAIVDQIWAFTSGHPNIVQRLCRRLVKRLSEQGTRQITLQDVDAVIEDSDFQREDFLSTYWQAATSLEKIISLLMADDKGIRTLRTVRQALVERCSLHPKGREVDDALQRLVDLRSILKRTPTGYKFAVEAFPRVVAETMTLDDMLVILTEEYQEHGE